MGRSVNFKQVFDAAIFFPRTARGHGMCRKKGHSHKCVCKDCGPNNPHLAHVSKEKSPTGTPLNGRQANAVLHFEGVR